MAGFNISSLVFAIVIALILLFSGQFTEAEVCNGDIAKVGTVCKEFVLKPGPQKDPSPQCCQVIQDADMPCICANIPKGSEDIISMEKAVYISKFCGKPLKSGTKCGDYTVPSA